MEIQDLPKDKTIILFDGVCNLCDSLVQKIIKLDKKDNFRFVSLQSQLGIEIINHIGLSNKNIDSIVLYQIGKAYYYKSEAVFEIAKIIGGKFYWIKFFGLFPKFITDYAYDFVAKNRYKWYGKKDNCMIPSPEILDKFYN
jgi:predicted DCC family thiol-disulfide oxidoreductase YuxK